ncbi:putative transposase Ptta/En/Spm plant protein [Dioscorea alata]|uniref:Transposase Ptta/En/Spm plant protein n=1 Tax=Dioscorea alata TaxID=55571 RepID=A0ACB7TYQ3_DIOAL|nr:putative transposase Ptta/En/Spm plant protein [Dioscorea alata]
MPRLKLKAMKVVRSETSTSQNAATSNEVGTSSARMLEVQPRTSTHSSGTDSNRNGDDDNQDHGNIHENTSGVVNVNTVDNAGRHKGRGRTTLKELWAMPPEEKVLVSANRLGQPIGPEAQLFSSFLGMIARSSQKIGLHYESWHKVPKTLKDELLNFIEMRFVLEIPKDYVLKSLGKKWRDYKHDLKKKHFKREDGLQANKEKRPEGTINWQWEELVDFWYSRKGEESEQVGVSSRKQQKYTHTSGSKSFARKEKEMELRSGKKIGRFEFFKATHTKKDGSYLNKETEDIMILTEYDSIDGDEGMAETEILTQVIGKERHGRVRGLGLGPTPTQYYGHSSSRRPATCGGHSSECIELRQQMDEKFQKMEDELGRERANYNALYTFLQQQFPGATIPLPTIGGSFSQSQVFQT